MRVMTLYYKLSQSPQHLPPCPLEVQGEEGSDSEWEDIEEDWEEEEGDEGDCEWIQFSDKAAEAPTPTPQPHPQDQVDGAPLSIPSTSKRRKVQFREKDLVQVHEVEENADWKDYRKSFWELCYVDRCRFRELVLRTEQALGNIFSPEHREKVFRTRVLPYLTQQEDGDNQGIEAKDEDKDDHRMDVDVQPQPPTSASASAVVGSSNS